MTDLQQEVKAENTTDANAIFIAFDSYPWTEDPRFAALASGMKARGMAVATTAGLLTARVAYAAKMLNLSVNKTEYTEWVKAQGPDYQQPEAMLMGLFAAAPDADSAGSAADEAAKLEPKAPVLDWQAAAPKLDLVVDAQAHSGTGQPPAKFAELLKCMQEGLPVPGVREIPSTVVRDSTIKPFGARAVPKKPWERNETAAAAAAAEGGLGASIDQDFPALTTD